MPGFVAKDQVDALDFNFEPYGPSGEIPEPSASQIQNFRSAIAEMFGELLPEDTKEEEQSATLVKKVMEYLGRDTTEIQQKILHAVADVCSDSPSFDTLEKLPYRHQQAFVGWISGVFLLPPVPTPATNA